jgi:long-subunit acyl-CoA synthetase (AMP-forming)
VLSEQAKEHNKTSIVESLRHTLTKVNNRLESHQKLDRIIIFKEEWSIENDLLTPTLKVKRHIIEEKFKSIILAIHTKDIVWNE